MLSTHWMNQTRGSKYKMDAENTKMFPFEIQDLESQLNEITKSYFKGELSGYVRTGPKGYILPVSYKEEAAKFYNMEIRPSDVFVITFPRSGTTYTQELIWLLGNDMDFAQAESITLKERFPFLEYNILFTPTLQNKMMDKHKHNKAALEVLTAITVPVREAVAAAPSPRFIKSHLPLSLLPPALLDTARVVFVARDPRDVAVSFYHHKRRLSMFGFDGDFKAYWNLFINDLIIYTPFFEFIKEAWEHRHHPHMMFIFYEEMTKDLPAVIQRVSKFLGKQCTGEQLTRLCDHLNIDNFRNNKSVNMDDLHAVSGLITPGEQPFIRNGKSGGWRDYFDAEMRAQAQRWMEHNLSDTDLRFPEHTE